jgi:RNA polymerase sigma factor (sigma-70 family)
MDATALDEGPTHPQDHRQEDPLAMSARALRIVLRRYFSKNGVDEGELDDLVQEVFLRLVRRGDVRDLEQLDGYVILTATSVLTDRWRRRKARHADRHIPFDEARHAEPVSGPDAALMARQALRSTSLSLLELTERERRVFLLRRMEGLPFAEISRRLGVSVSTVEKDMLRAVRHLMSSQEKDR